MPEIVMNLRASVGEREDMIAKFWLDPLRLQRSGGFHRPEIARIQRLIVAHKSDLMEAWDEYFCG